MEGPVPIYVKPNTFDYEPETTTTTTDEPPNMTPVPEMKGQNISKVRILSVFFIVYISNIFTELDNNEKIIEMHNPEGMT